MSLLATMEARRSCMMRVGISPSRCRTRDGGWRLPAEDVAAIDNDMGNAQQDERLSHTARRIKQIK